MPNVKITPVFSFAELSDSAKDAAREWCRSGALDYEWFEFSFEDHAQRCAALNIYLDSKARYFDTERGSSFAGRVNAFELLAAFEANSDLELPAPPELHRLVRELLTNDSAFVSATCRRCNGYSGEFNLRTEHVIDCDALFNDRHPRITAQLTALGEWSEAVLDAVNDNWFSALRSECDYLLSNDAVDESITINEYQFTAEGDMA